MKEETIKSSEALIPLPLLLRAAVDELIQELQTVKQEDINTVPFPGSWTAGQVGEHIVLSVSGITQLLNGPTGATDRSPDKYVQALKDMFMDFNLKFPAAQKITPADKVYGKEALISNLNSVFEDFINLAETKDLTDSCLGFNFPGMGYLTRLEWMYQTVYHTKRHTYQLENIKSHL